MALLEVAARLPFGKIKGISPNGCAVPVTSARLLGRGEVTGA
jgi:hypothetical protein